MAKKKDALRSQAWFGKADKDGFLHRSWMKNQGIPDDQFDGRPVIGILNTWSDLTPCNGHLRELAEKVKAGIWEAGGFPGGLYPFRLWLPKPAPSPSSVPPHLPTIEI